MEEKKQSVSTTEVRGSPSSQINNNTKQKYVRRKKEK